VLFLFLLYCFPCNIVYSQSSIKTNNQGITEMKTSGYVVSFLTLLFLATVVLPYGRGPKNSKTGAPGEGICAESDCHTDYEVNSGPGSFQLLGVPNVYTPGKTYPITIRISQKGQSRWGFQVTAIGGDSARSGEIAKHDDNLTQLDTDEVRGHERFYLKHTRRGTQRGTENGPVSWQFTWKAPDDSSEVVSFYAAGNAANGNRENSGDYIYQTSIKSYPDSSYLE